MSHPLEQLIASLTQRPRRMSGFDPQALEDPNVDPSVLADLGAGAMQGELRNRIFQAERTQPTTSRHEVDALRNLLGGYTNDRETSPLAMQQAQYDEQNKLNLGAMNEGFTGGPGQSPIQAREIERRKLEKEEMRQPIEKQSLIEQNENLRHGAEMDNRLDHARIQMEPALIDAKSRADYYNANPNANPSTDPNFRGMGRYGPQYFQPRATTAPLNPNAAMSNMQDASGALGSSDPFTTWNDPSPQQQFFNGGVMNMLRTSGLDADSQQSLLTVLREPEYRGIPLEAPPGQPSLKALAMQDPSFDERDWAKFAQLYVYFRQGR